MSAKEYRTVAAARGGLLIVNNVPRVAFGDRVLIRDYHDRKRNGQVIRSAQGEALIQVYEGTDDLGTFSRPAAGDQPLPGADGARLQWHR